MRADRKIYPEFFMSGSHMPEIYVYLQPNLFLSSKSSITRGCRINLQFSVRVFFFNQRNLPRRVSVPLSEPRPTAKGSMTSYLSSLKSSNVGMKSRKGCATRWPSWSHWTSPAPFLCCKLSSPSGNNSLGFCF